MQTGAHNIATHQPPAIEPKKHPPVNVETIAPITEALGLSKSPRKVLNVSTEEMMPLKESSPVSVSVSDIEEYVRITHLSYLRNGDIKEKTQDRQRTEAEDV